MTARYVGRTAPSASGAPHVGTLYSAWRALTRAKQQGGIAWIRIDDLDQHRVRAASLHAIVDALLMLGFDAQHVVRQSDAPERYAAALDTLAAMGVLYECDCDKARIRALQVQLPDGGFGYDNHCRDRLVRQDTWRAAAGSLRVALDAHQQGRAPMSMLAPSAHVRWGDPIVRRKDHMMAYVFTSVVDDIAMQVTEVVRGRDLQQMVPTQQRLFAMLGAHPPQFVHHRLLLAPDGKKWSKSKGDGQTWNEQNVGELMRAFASMDEQQDASSSRAADVIFCDMCGEQSGTDAARLCVAP